jgi:hypothetical protein
MQIHGGLSWHVFEMHYKIERVISVGSGMRMTQEENEVILELLSPNKDCSMSTEVIIKWSFLQAFLPLESFRLVHLNLITLIHCQALNIGNSMRKLAKHPLLVHLRGATTSE